MSLIEWSDDYIVGNAQIDDQHRYLFQLINAFYDAYMENQSRREVMRLLNQLIEYSESHFQDEEAIMRQAGYSEVDTHHHAHEGLYDQIFALNTKFDDRALNPTHDTISFLRTWLTDHIMKEDMAFAAFSKSKEGGSADGAKSKTGQAG